MGFDDTSKLKLHLNEEPKEEDSYQLPGLFAEATHLKTTPKTRNGKWWLLKKMHHLIPKWTPY